MGAHVFTSLRVAPVADHAPQAFQENGPVAAGQNAVRVWLSANSHVCVPDWPEGQAALVGVQRVVVSGAGATQGAAVGVHVLA